MSARPPIWPMYRAMVGVGLVCGLLIVGVFEWTAPIIARKRAEALERAVFRVLPAATSSRTFALGDDGAFSELDGPAESAPVVYAGYDDDLRLVGVAIEAEGMGYQDVIHVLWGYAPQQEAIVGVQVLESRETPGLGDRIETDPDFLANFERLDVALTADGAALVNPIVGVKHGGKTDPWQVDGITGATISSFAIADMLRDSAAWWVPRVRRGLDDLGHPDGAR